MKSFQEHRHDIIMKYSGKIAEDRLLADLLDTFELLVRIDEFERCFSVNPKVEARITALEKHYMGDNGGI